MGLNLNPCGMPNINGDFINFFISVNPFVRNDVGAVGKFNAKVKCIVNDSHDFRKGVIRNQLRSKCGKDSCGLLFGCDVEIVEFGFPKVDDVVIKCHKMYLSLFCFWIGSGIGSAPFCLCSGVFVGSVVEFGCKAVAFKKQSLIGGAFFIGHSICHFKIEHFVVEFVDSVSDFVGCHNLYLSLFYFGWGVFCSLPSSHYYYITSQA